MLLVVEALYLILVVALPIGIMVMLNNKFKQLQHSVDDLAKKLNETNDIALNDIKKELDAIQSKLNR